MVLDEIAEHVARDIQPKTEREREMIQLTINVLFALGYIPTYPEMQAKRDAHVAELKAAGIPDAAIG